MPKSLMCDLCIGWIRHLNHYPLSWRVERAGIVDLGHLMIGKAEHLPQDFVGMFAQQRGARHLGRAVGHLDGIADREVFAALGMIDLDYGAAGPQRLILDQLLS